MVKKALTFFGIYLLCATSCAMNEQFEDEANTQGALGTTSTCSGDLRLAGTWTVTNHGLGTTGEVTFKSDLTYTIDSGTYNAGGSWRGATSGTYKTLPAGAILFTYAGTMPVTSRIAAVKCATSDRIVHFVLGHSHDYEEITRKR